MFSKLSSRERILAAAGIVLIPFAVLFYLFFTISGGLSSRREEIENLQLDQQQLVLREAKAKRVLARGRVYAKESLPSDSEKASNLYAAWLRRLAAEVFGQGNGTVNPGASFEVNAGPGDRIYKQQSFTLKSEVNIRQVTEFLYAFYRARILHRISSFSLIKKADARGERARPDGLLSLEMTIQAAILADAPAARDFERDQREDLPHALEKYHDIVTRRNLFGPPNQPPEFTTAESQEVVVGKDIEVEIEARDPDSDEAVLVPELVAQESSPELRLEKRGDRYLVVSEKPQIGQYKARLRTTDNGWPRKPAELDLEIRVEKEEVVVREPPPKAPVYAREAYVSGFTYIDAKPVVWISVPLPEPVTHKLSIGGSFELDNMKWTVHSIDKEKRRVTFEVNNNLLTFQHSGSLGEPMETKPAG
jgi:hypothetical protein